jgi:hypothetical protein
LFQLAVFIAVDRQQRFGTTEIPGQVSRCLHWIDRRISAQG